jgi:hypothetical protein
MFAERKEDLSIYYWLQEKFSGDYAGVKIVDGFPEEILATPSVSIEWDTIKGLDHELGNRKVLKERIWYLDIFANNKSQRDDIAYKIFNDLDNGIPVLDYDQGFPPETTPEKLGSLLPVEREIRNLHSYLEQDLSNLSEKLYYRAVVIFTAVFDKF